MFLSILHNASGEEFLRRLAPNESLDPRKHARAWLDRNYDGELRASFSKPGAHIPGGCGEYTAEIRHTKAATGSCWASEDFYTEAA